MVYYEVHDALKILNVIGIHLDVDEEDEFRRSYKPSKDVILATQEVYASLVNRLPYGGARKVGERERRKYFCQLFNSVDRRGLQRGLRKGEPLDALLGKLAW